MKGSSGERLAQNVSCESAVVSWKEREREGFGRSIYGKGGGRSASSIARVQKGNRSSVGKRDAGQKCHETKTRVRVT